GLPGGLYRTWPGRQRAGCAPALGPRNRNWHLPQRAACHARSGARAEDPSGGGAGGREPGGGAAPCVSGASDGAWRDAHLARWPHAPARASAGYRRAAQAPVPALERTARRTARGGMSHTFEEVRLRLPHLEVAAHLSGPEDGRPVIA